MKRHICKLILSRSRRLSTASPAHPPIHTSFLRCAYSTATSRPTTGQKELVNIEDELSPESIQRETKERAAFFTKPNEDHVATGIEVPAAKNLTIPLPKGTIEDLYDVLATPVARDDSKTYPTDKRSPEYVASLDFSFLDTRDTDVKEGLETKMNEAVSQPVTVQNINTIIHANALLARAQEAQQAFDLIEKSGLTPDIKSWSNLLNAYANAKDLRGVVDTFKSLKSSSPNLKPDTITYGIMIKACVNMGQIEPAFKFYEEMKEKGVQVSQPIFTTLIKGCIRTKDFQRAWKTFDYMRLEICQPDEVAYSAMINLCSKNNEPERAFDLFTEMQEKKLTPTDVTFNSLIQSCGRSEEFYPQAFVLFENMLESGFEPDIITFTSLLGAAARRPDIKRLRMIWNDMIKRSESDPRFLPDEKSLLQLMHGFSLICSKLSKGTKVDGFVLGKYERNVDDNTPAVEMMEDGQEHDSELSMSDTSKDAQEHSIDDPNLRTQSAELTPVTQDQTLDQDEFTIGENADALADTEPSTSTPSEPELLTELTTEVQNPLALQDIKDRYQIADETMRIYKHITRHDSNIQLSTRLFNSFLSVFTYNRMDGQALEFFEEHRNKVTFNGETYKHMLRELTKNKFRLEQAESLFKEMKEWDESRESQLMNLTESEKEEARIQDGRGREHWFGFYRLMVLGRTRVHDLDGAMDLIQESQQFRYPTYLAKFHFKDVYSLLEKCLDKKDEGIREPITRLMELLPQPPTQTALDEVRDMLSKKYLNRNWWGFEAIGLSPKQELERVRKLRTEKKHKEKQKKAMSMDKRLGVSEILKLKPRRYY